MHSQKLRPTNGTSPRDVSVYSASSVTAKFGGVSGCGQTLPASGFTAIARWTLPLESAPKKRTALNAPGEAAIVSSSR